MEELRKSLQAKSEELLAVTSTQQSGDARLEILEQEKAKLTSRLHKLKEVAGAFPEQLRTLNTSLAETQEALDRSHAIEDELRTELQTKKSECEKFSIQLDTLTREFEIKIHQNADIEAKHVQLSQELEFLRESASRERDHLSNTHELEIASISAHERQLEESAKILEEEIFKVRADRDKLVETQSSLEARIQQVEDQLINVSKELDDKIAEAQKKAKSEDDAAWDAWRAKIGNTKVNLDLIGSRSLHLNKFKS